MPTLFSHYSTIYGLLYSEDGGSKLFWNIDNIYETTLYHKPKAHNVNALLDKSILKHDKL
jgi:hypothetical protein